MRDAWPNNATKGHAEEEAAHVFGVIDSLQHSPPPPRGGGGWFHRGAATFLHIASCIGPPYITSATRHHDSTLSVNLQENTIEHGNLSDDNGDEGDPRSFSQMLRDGIEDAIEALQAGDDGGRWHKGQISNCERESPKEDDEVERVGSGLEALVCPLELLRGLPRGVRKSRRGGEGESFVAGEHKRQREGGLHDNQCGA